MIKGLVIDSATGTILRKVECATDSDLALQAGSGEAVRLFANVDGIYVNDAEMKVDLSEGGSTGQIIAIDPGTFDGDLPTGVTDPLELPE